MRQKVCIDVEDPLQMKRIGAIYGAFEAFNLLTSTCPTDL